MQKRCRATCKDWAEGRPLEEFPDDLKISGVYQDIIETEFNDKGIKICDLSQGFTVAAMEKIIGVLTTNKGQPPLVPQFSKVGFEKMKIPRDIYAHILTNRKKLLSTKKKWKVEYCVPGMQNCNRIVESKNAKECHEVSRENYFYLPLSQNTLDDIFQRLLPIAETWIGNKIKLVGAQVYGIRFGRELFLAVSSLFSLQEVHQRCNSCSTCGSSEDSCHLCHTQYQTSTEYYILL